jgi:hypothetical protein
MKFDKDEDFEPRSTDMALVIRNGVPFLHAPDNQGGKVPQDFLMLVGIAAAWDDRNFRHHILAAVDKLAASGILDSIMSSHEKRPN